MNEIQELEAIRDANGILASQQVECTSLEPVYVKLSHARAYLNGIASRILNVADEF